MPAPSSRCATFALALSVWAACGADTRTAAPGVTEAAVTFGQSGCFTGTCATPGLQYRAGILAAKEAAE